MPIQEDEGNAQLIMQLIILRIKGYTSPKLLSNMFQTFQITHLQLDAVGTNS
jgi:hypothetical protein